MPFNDWSDRWLIVALVLCIIGVMLLPLFDGGCS